MSERARGFPAFGPGTRRSGGFARSWWGREWIRAVEDAALDAQQLRHGRKYARTGYVGAITVSPGRLAASVRDYEDDTAYRTVVTLSPLSDAGWDRFLDQVATRAGHIAALLDGDVPHDLVSAAADAGVRLLPEIGDLDPDCTCPGWELPCKHAAALSYQVAWLLDEDPFVLLLLRGRTRDELLDELHGRDAPVSAARPVPAAEAFAAPRAALPDPPPPPPPPTEPAATPAVPPAEGVDPAVLEVLASHAALRARDLLTGEPASTTWQDTVRLAALHPRVLARLPELDLPARAWTFGGRVALDVLETSWTPARTELARARAALAAGWDGDDGPDFDVRGNRWTAAGHGVQLRLGRDGRWYPYRDRDGTWWPVGPPAPDPVTALADLLA
ncbi:SWIM zinc finger family protein [Umezawaea beigongshangensis]|uniref:SWIM zinc finger family protein n=1 Tax=Umezawaea beigongshangensis TaxID=2780383 RepID=UPI0018F1175D|nr:SWIM zinc finger family protein [Umezawaea beigongshangensis]